MQDNTWADAGFTPAEAAAWQAVGPDDLRGTNLLMSNRASANGEPWAFEGKCRVPIEYGTSNSQVQARGFNLYLKDADDAAQEAFFRPAPFTLPEAVAWCAVGVKKPVVALDWRRFGLSPAQYAMYTKRRVKASWSAYVTHTQLAMTPGEGLDLLGAFSVKEATNKTVLPRYRALDAALRAGVVDVALADVLVADIPGLPTEWTADGDAPQALERLDIAGAIMDGTLDWARLQRVYAHILALTGLDPAAMDPTAFATALVPYLGAVGNARTRRWEREARAGWGRDEAFDVVLGLTTKAALDKMAHWATQDVGTMHAKDVAPFLEQDVPLSWVRSFVARGGALGGSSSDEWRAAGFDDEDAAAWAAVGPDTFVGTRALLNNSKDWPFLAALQVPAAYGTADDETQASATNAFLKKASADQQEAFFRPVPFTPAEAAEWREVFADPTTAANWRRFAFTPGEAAMYLRHCGPVASAAYLVHRELRMTPGAGLDLVRPLPDRGLAALWLGFHVAGDLRFEARSLRAADAALRAGSLSVQLATAALGAWRPDTNEGKLRYWIRSNLGIDTIDWALFQRSYDHIRAVLALTDLPTDDARVPVPAEARRYFRLFATRPGWERDAAFEAVLGLESRAELDRLAEFAATLDERIEAGEAPVLTLAGVLPYLAQDVPVSSVTTSLGSR